MKTLFVRLSVLALAFTGFAAASVTSHSASTHTIKVKQSFNSSNQPQCNCGWNDKTMCNID